MIERGNFEEVFSNNFNKCRCSDLCYLLAACYIPVPIIILKHRLQGRSWFTLLGFEVKMP